MRLHYYTSSAPHPFYLGVHHGHGFGSIFARLFSKVAAKTAAKTALSAAKVAGRKALKVVVKQGTRMAKEGVKSVIDEAKKVGKELAVQGIDTLSQKAINKGIPADMVHNVSNVVREGAHTALDRLSTAADRGVEKIATRLDPVSSRKRTLPFLTESPIAKEKRVVRPAAAVSGSKVQHHRKRKRKTFHHHIPSSKRVRYNLQNDIEES